MVKVFINVTILSMSRKGKPLIVNKKYHYVYKLTLKEDERFFYIGKRSTDNEDDSEYMGSGKGLIEYKKKFGKDCFNKEILSYWKTSDEAFNEESRLVTKDVVNNEFCLNRIVGGGAFDTTGCKWGKRTPEQIEAMRKISTGVKKSDTARKKLSESIKKKWQDESYRERQKKGRDGKYTEHLKKLNQERIGQVVIIKDNSKKFIDKENVEKYLKDGWKLKHNFTYEEIENLRKQKLSYSKIGKIYNVSESAIRCFYRREKLKREK